MNDAKRLPPPVTDAELRAAGFSPAARQFPRSEVGARWIAAFNGVPFDGIPDAWWYASNAYMNKQIAGKFHSHVRVKQS